MAKRLPLDTRFAIADAFDNGTLRGESTVNEIAAAVGANPKSVGRSLRVMGFRMVRKSLTITERIPARWEPPRQWPTLERHTSTTQAIVLAYKTGGFQAFKANKTLSRANVRLAHTLRPTIYVAAA